MKNKEIIELIIFSLRRLNKKEINKLLPVFFKKKKLVGLIQKILN